MVMSKPIVLAVGIFVAIATSFFQALMTHDIVRSNAEAVREAREASKEIRELREQLWQNSRKHM